ncbi:MAG: LUD domain-containing protein [Ruminococcaceae bacterium]|nr:LUD domain-containing protein [Oscillospiraceae bacterium]
MNRELLKKNFEGRQFIVEFFDDKNSLLSYLKENVKNEVIAFGGSATVSELDLPFVLEEKNSIIWHAKSGDSARYLGFSVDTYFLSANAVSETGYIVNIDGNGNRVAASLFGPKRVIYIIGKNKITPSLEEAMDRARNVAAPKNAKRLSVSTPCAAKGDRCYKCELDNKICRATVIIERATSPRTELLFADFDLGF